MTDFREKSVSLRHLCVIRLFVDFRKKLLAHGVLASMSGKGNCFYNAAVETFFKSLKSRAKRINQRFFDPSTSYARPISLLL
ncbi:hypothetical protein AD935_00405 [Gluconobacter japonicus]|nr:hypothetical protein AD935_00405 [Gluconobacter japonicus]